MGSYGCIEELILKRNRGVAQMECAQNAMKMIVIANEMNMNMAAPRCG
jgi:hypothetical protein